MPRVRFRLRSLLIAVALCAVALGIGLEWRRLRRLSVLYRARASAHSASEKTYRREVARVRGGRRHDLISIAHVLADATYHAALAAKYRDAEAHPWRAVDPDPPRPRDDPDRAAFRAAVIEVASQWDGPGLDLMMIGLRDEDLARLPVLPRIERLSLIGNPKITDAGLRHLLRAFPNVQHLDLNLNPGITDAGLNELARIPSLRQLGLGGSGVTPEAVYRLAARCPDVTIHF